MKLQPTLRKFAAAFGALLCCASPLVAGGVRIVDATGARNFPDIQSAIQAAVDGDVLLVGAGTHPAFTVDGKSLSIFAAPPGADVVTEGRITLSNVSGRCLVVGLRAEQIAPPLYSADAMRLAVTNCSGVVILQDCTFHAGPVNVEVMTEVTANVTGSTSVLFSHCEFQGHNPSSFYVSGLPGGTGVRVLSSALAAYECSFRGGNGNHHGSYPCPGCWGGTGLLAGAGASLFASRCSFLGGEGGVGSTHCGSGGDGLVVLVQGSSEAHLLDNTCAGGPPGFCNPTGQGLPISGAGWVDLLPGTARTFAQTSICVDRVPWSLSVSGVAGDQVFLNRSLAPVFQYEPALSGVCTSLLPPFPAVPPLGVVPASGSLAPLVRQRLLPGNVVAQLYFLQGYVTDPAGATILGSPLHTLSLNWNSRPDCNGNGINDYAEVIAGVAADANHDLVPDDCP